MEIKRILSTSSTGFEKVGQTYRLTTVHEILRDGEDRLVIRTDVRHDNYPEHSSNVAEVWLAGKGWTEVARVHGADILSSDMASGYLHDRKIVWRSANAMTGILLSQALRILG